MSDRTLTAGHLLMVVGVVIGLPTALLDHDWAQALWVLAAAGWAGVAWFWQRVATERLRQLELRRVTIHNLLQQQFREEAP